MSQTIYRLQGIRKEYNGRRVVDIGDMTISAGEILGLIGPSGAGKSTLLRLLNFLEPPTQGTITFADEKFGPALNVPLNLRRRITTVFQQPLLLNLSVIENVAFGLKLQNKPDANAKSIEALRQVGLESQAKARAKDLSGGEAQRVALARAIVLEPDVLLLDEPTANLDPYNVSLIERIVQTLNEQRKTTVVIVTHNVFQARRICQRAALMLDGKMIEISENHSFFNQPQDPRTAAFISGEMIY